VAESGVGEGFGEPFGPNDSKRERQCVRKGGEGRLHGWNSRDQLDAVSVSPGDGGVRVLDLDPGGTERHGVYG